jgi:ferredoxin
MMRRLVVSFLLLWLPLQGLAAVTMPFCRHALDADTQPAAQPQAHAQHSHHAQEHGAPVQERHAADDPGGLACNDCGACHLACAAVMLSEPPVHTLALAAARVNLPPPLSPPALVLDQPNPPPLSRG